MHRLSRRIADKRVLRLIGRYLRAGINHGGKIEPTSTGVPQGGPLSPLPGNIVLHDLDRELELRGHYYARYADDAIILVKSRRAGQRVLTSISRFLEQRLKLKVNRQKSKVIDSKKCTFLGFTFTRGKIRWTHQAFTTFKNELKRLTARSWGVSMHSRLTPIAHYVRGWMGYYRLSKFYRPIPELDHWLRRRVRMCYWSRAKRDGRPLRSERPPGASTHGENREPGYGTSSPWEPERPTPYSPA